ncbi:phage tail protein [Pseudomonas sp. B26(2017)]|uniref:phage tail protein n=1 Tax=Pseudomonas sp. B26(2017) TaxID=1981732 RepID=UPI000A1F3283|nr:phage tail protein [Pseudomonas sp. B26(2017)]
MTDVTVAKIDWSQLITKEMTEAAAAAQELAAAKAELSSLNAVATKQIARIQDRVDTLGYGVEAGVATEDDEAELASLTASLKDWKAYKFALGKVSTQSTWPAAPVWPDAPDIPEIAGDATGEKVDTA